MWRWVAAAAVVCAASGAQAQSLISTQSIGSPSGPGFGFYPSIEQAAANPGQINPATDYIAVNRQFGNVTDFFGRPSGTVLAQDFAYIPIASLQGGSSAQINAIQQQVTANSVALTNIAARLDRLNDRFSEGIALAGSFNVLPPNPGDRFAVYTSVLLHATTELLTHSTSSVPPQRRYKR